MAVVDLDQVRMYEFLHHVDFFERLLDLEGVHVDLLEGVGALLAVADEVDAAEAALPDDVHRFVLLHTEYNHALSRIRKRLFQRMDSSKYEGTGVGLGNGVLLDFGPCFIGMYLWDC